MKVNEAISKLSNNQTIMNARIAVLEQRVALLEIDRDKYKDTIEKLGRAVNVLNSKVASSDIIEGLMRNGKEK